MTDDAIQTYLYVVNSDFGRCLHGARAGDVAPARAGQTFSVTNLITNNQAVNPADHGPEPGQSLGRFVLSHESALGFR